MGEGLIVPGVCRFTVSGVYAGRNVANVLDYFIGPAGGVSRIDAIEDLAGRIVSSWADDVMDNLSDEYIAQRLSWVDMDSALGSVGETTTGVGTDFPFAGLATGDPFPGNVSCRVNKNITALRGQRQGRMYLPGGIETWTTGAAPNTIQAATVTAINTDMAAFLAATTVAPGGSPDYFAEMVVVHTETIPPVPPSTTPTIEFNGTSSVSSLTVDATLASQRRRLRG